MPEPMITHTVTRDDGSTYEVQVPKRLIQRFKRICKSMAAFLDEITEHAPEAGLYLEGSGNPTLMAGSTHIGPNASQCKENVLADGATWARLYDAKLYTVGDLIASGRFLSSIGFTEDEVLAIETEVAKHVNTRRSR